ncbi:ABC1-domain-containing protein [Xylariomycetidae sp. FL0641]|nr:ABC1-domain-containing protein [Xylariomycetidae sp. FL0641]
MRFADILVDLASIASASRSVAGKHFELRARQLERYGQTSSVVRSLRGNNAPFKTADRTDDSGTQTTGSGENTQQTEEYATGASDGETQGPSTNAPINRGSSGAPEWQHGSRDNLSQRSHPLEDVTARRPSTIRPDQSAILSQLQQGSGGPRYSAAHKSSAGAAETRDVPPDVDLNIFHTSRGSEILEEKRDAVSLKRPKAPLPKPSWFKDFGHDKARRQEDTAKAEPSVSAAFPGKANTPAEKNAATANRSGETSCRADGSRPEVSEERKSAPPSSQAGSGRADSAGIEDASPDHISKDNSKAVEENRQMVDKILEEAKQEEPPQQEAVTAKAVSGESPAPVYALRESKVPATRMSRLWNYGGLAAGMLGGAITESFSRGFGGGGEGSVMFSPANMERLVAKLSRMRGAALKLGQLMSFQDSKMLPGPIREVLQRVQDRADYMPAWQRDRVLTASLGPEWRELFSEFEETPMAAASIGQVHRATLKSSGQEVAVKIQFPGVADSINSDLDNLSMLLTASKMLPKGLYLNKTIDNARTELGWECDYEREAECGERYRELLADEPDVFQVPRIYREASGRHVLTMEFMHGVGVTRGGQAFTQAQRDWIGTQILRLCLREIGEFRFMQTDPNWTNFQYEAAAAAAAAGGAGRLQLLDFGASRAYPDDFVRLYLSLLRAAARRDRDALVAFSRRLGYLTGHESRAMLDAHVASILTLAEPFLDSAPAAYDFADQTITERVKALIPVMVRERLSPPPEETYSLHRKLSGAFLLCARLGSRVRCRELFEKALRKTDLELE